jgi:dihydroflavonol-4-reductase
MTARLVTQAPVCVTGAAGFIASRIIEQLLDRGYRVRGTVRNLGKVKELAHLRALPGAAERLDLVEADLLHPEAFPGAVAGCEQVMHTASPYALDVKDPQKDLVDPAVQGTRNVLAACQGAGTVKRVVLTSSMAAITDEPEGDHVLTEKDWNTRSSLDRNPYYYSKTLAEKEGWRFVEEEKAAFRLVVINPFLVIGPSLSPGLNTSNQMFVDLLGGAYPGIMNLTWGFVDVRDVADAHVRAMETEGASGRYLCAADTIAMREVVALLAEAGYADGYKLPKIGLDCAVGDFTVRLSSYLQPKGVGSYLRTHVGRVPRYDTAKIRAELGIAFRPAKQSILDTVADLDRWGHLPARGGAKDPAGKVASQS